MRWNPGGAQARIVTDGCRACCCAAGSVAWPRWGRVGSGAGNLRGVRSGPSAWTTPIRRNAPGVARGSDPGSSGFPRVAEPPFLGWLTLESIVASPHRSGRWIDPSRSIRTRRDGIAIKKTRNRAVAVVQDEGWSQVAFTTPAGPTRARIVGTTCSENGGPELLFHRGSIVAYAQLLLGTTVSRACRLGTAAGPVDTGRSSKPARCVRRNRRARGAAPSFAPDWRGRSC